MDERRFDNTIRMLASGLPRRTVLHGIAAVAGGWAARRSQSAVSAAVEAERCMGIGKRCGGQRQPACHTCCTGYAPKLNGRPQRRCACRPDLRRCDRPDQCCSGVCRVPCEGGRRPICLPGFIGDAC